ncbi:hypothetical protein [Rhizobium sp. AG855]|uniref:hypothetical protein n=1 Tax=Rhizobium sp. AG855 TaxID=2183898 RepID=UPI000E70AA19|nr:hypothetical protein [Rhizobium sp. AG855]RKE83982.1 hypothetical protein DFO46_0742 [Rhizobium sp. AG855]
MDLISGLAAAGHALDIVKRLRDLDSDLKGAEAKLQLADLYGKMADVKMALADAQSALQERDAEITRLRQVASKIKPTVEINGYSFGLDAEGKPLYRAFCPVCERSDGSQIMVEIALVPGKSVCPKCGGVFDQRSTSLPVNYAMPSA